jgi:Alginate lyase
VPRARLIVALLALAITLTACGGPAPPAPPPTSAPPSPARYPGDVLDLHNWYLTLPTGTTGSPDNVYPPELLTFSNQWFRLDDARDGVVFTANAGGATTKGSNYPRSELREMQGGKLASWSNVSGTHTMTLRQAITRLPLVKPHVVSAQIHDAEDDVVEIRLEGRELIAQYNDGGTDVTIDPAYALGTPYDLSITAANSRIEVHYNGRLAAEIPVAGDGWYFKAGSYVQSNPQRGDAPDAIGEVVIHSLGVEHGV